MKIFQILDGFCHWDATSKHPTLDSTIGLYAPDIIFVEAPDKVHEGWGYDETKTGDDRFIQPEPPEGWAYDESSGTFYPIDQEIISTLQLGSEDEYSTLSKTELIQLCKNQQDQIQAMEIQVKALEASK